MISARKRPCRDRLVMSLQKASVACAGADCSAQAPAQVSPSALPQIRASTRLRIAAGLLLAISAFCAVAQVHEARRGDFVLRSSTVASDRINPATAGKHGIEPSPTRGVLNVTVLRGRNGRTVPAEVAASSVNLAGVRQDIEMREVRAGGRVSYLGSYDFLPREVIDFEITARPLRPANSRPLSLKYRDRMWAR